MVSPNEMTKSCSSLACYKKSTWEVLHFRYVTFELMADILNKFQGQEENYLHLSVDPLQSIPNSSKRNEHVLDNMHIMVIVSDSLTLSSL